MIARMMRTPRWRHTDLRRLALAALLLVATAWPAVAGKVVLRIRAGNPIDKPQTVQIRSSLPSPIGVADILSTAGLDIGYEVKSGTYYVHKEVELQPKEIRVFNIELNDVWSISPDELKRLREAATALVGKLSGRSEAADADKLRKEIEKNLDLIESTQAQSAVKPGEKILEHIKVHEANLGTLRRVKEGVGRLENTVLGAGLDPGGELIGEVKAMPREELELPPEAYKTALIRITVRNTSPTEVRTVPVRRELPPEIRLDDILDGGGLDSAADPQTGICYLYKKEVEVPPAQTLTFDVKIRDKWNTGGPRMDALGVAASNVLEVVGKKGEFKSVEATLQGILSELETLRQVKGPETLNEKYVAFYREQAARLNVLEQKILRIEAALRPKPKTTELGFKTKAPSMKTTWIIIYIILGFLAVMSLLFFLRWFGKTGAEKMDGGGAGT